MRIPNDIRKGLRQLLWAKADELGWGSLTWIDKTKHYDIWGKDPDVGGKLSRYMDQREVRVYIKDTVMKGYGRTRTASPARALGALNLSDVEFSKQYERPHGRLLKDGRIIAWGNASDWKAILMAIHERTFVQERATPFAAVLIGASGRFSDPHHQRIVMDAAQKLSIGKVVWLP